MTTAPTVTEKRYSVEEWLELEKTADARHEYYFGKLIPMAGEAKRANIIAGNIRRCVDVPFYEKGFQIFDHDIKAEVVPDGIYRYPDLVAAPIVDDEHDYIVKHPVFMAEVASDRSAQRDRVKKRKECFAIPSLWYYLIADQDEMLVERHARGADGRWEQHYFTEPGDVIALPKFGVEFTVAAVYERVKLPV